MQWTQLKKRIENGFARSVQGRVSVHAARYRHSHDSEGRGWITLDKREIASFATLGHWMAEWKLQTALREANKCADYNDPAQNAGYHDAQRQANAVLLRQGSMTYDNLYYELEGYLNLSIEQALDDDSVVMRALAVIDRRLGKRRLADFALRVDELPLVTELLAFRKEVEGIRAGGHEGLAVGKMRGLSREIRENAGILF